MSLRSWAIPIKDNNLESDFSTKFLSCYIVVETTSELFNLIEKVDPPCKASILF